LKEIIIEQRFTFKKEEKLKSRKLIEFLFKEGKSFSNFPFRVLYLLIPQNHSHLQTGFAVSAKHFKKAVDRNRIKRLSREAYRLQKSFLTHALQTQKKFMIVFFIYTGNEIPEYKNVEERMQAALNRLNKTANEITDANT